MIGIKLSENMNNKEKYPSFPKENDEKTIENIVRQYQKTNDCEFQTNGELREWQIAELNKLFKKQIIEFLVKIKTITEHLSQQERNEYFDLQINYAKHKTKLI